MILNFYKLEIFNTVVQVGSFSAAADQLLMTQSAVSQHIHDLEASLGTKLFKRGRRGVTLTTSGEILHGYSQRITQLVTEAEHAVMNVENLKSGQVRLGSTPGVSAYLLPSWIQRFRTRFPNFTVRLQTNITKQIINDVLEHRLDLGFIEGELDDTPKPRLGSIVLQKIELFVVIGKGHPWCQRKSISIAELANQPFITRQRHSQTRVWLDNLLQSHGIGVQVVAEFDNQESIKNAVISGMGMTILPDYAVRDRIQQGVMQCLRIEEVPLQRQLRLIWDRELPFSPITTTFLGTLAKDYPQLLRKLD